MSVNIVKSIKLLLRNWWIIFYYDIILRESFNDLYLRSICEHLEYGKIIQVCNLKSYH